MGFEVPEYSDGQLKYEAVKAGSKGQEAADLARYYGEGNRQLIDAIGDLNREDAELLAHSLMNGLKRAGRL